MSKINFQRRGEEREREREGKENRGEKECLLPCAVMCR